MKYRGHMPGREMKSKLTVFQPRGDYPDPHLWIEPASLLNIRFAAFEGLVGYDADLNIIPVLAERWETSEDATVWEFFLREGIRFHDGMPLTAADAAASIRNASRKEVCGAYGTDALLYSYLGQAKVEPIDDRNLRITLPSPMADLPDLLVYIVIIPERFIGADPKTIPGTGPFCPEKFENSRFHFRRNEDYWKNIPEPEELIFVVEEDPEKRAKALLSGEADIATDLNWSHTTLIDENDECLAIEYDPPVAIPLMLNCSGGPLADVRVRQALNYGTDVNEVIQKACKGAALPLTGPLTPHHFGYDPFSKPYPYDTGKAWQLLSDAGYPDGLELTIYRPTVMPDESGAVTKNLKEQWARIGIKLHIEVQPDRAQYAEDVRAKRIHDLCIFDSAPLSTYRVLREKLDSSVRGPWWQGYDSPAFNELLSKAARTVDKEKRRLIYREAIRIAVDEAAWVFLYSPVKYFGLTWNVYERFPALCGRADGILLFN